MWFIYIRKRQIQKIHFKVEERRRDFKSFRRYYYKHQKTLPHKQKNEKSTDPSLPRQVLWFTDLNFSHQVEWYTDDTHALSDFMMHLPHTCPITFYVAPYTCFVKFCGVPTSYLPLQVLGCTDFILTTSPVMPRPHTCSVRFYNANAPTLFLHC